MDLAGRLQQLEEMVREAKSMPLSSSALLNRDEVLEMIQEMQESLPEEVKQARWIVKDREELLGKARHEAERIVDQAREDQLRMARKEDVVQRATEEADRIVAEAEQQAVEARAEAETYVDAKLAQFEIALRRVMEGSQSANRALAKTLDQVEVGRERLRAPTSAAEQEFGTAPDPEAQLFDADGDR
jgi:vacuolar-type H+-ATPase subunit H